MDFLIEVNGELVTCPSVSPENTYIMKDGTQGRLSYGVTMDNEILHELFDHFEKSSTLLQETDIDFLPKSKKKWQKKYQKSKSEKHGQIMEWMKDYDEAEPGGTATSHICGHFIRLSRLRRITHRIYVMLQKSHCRTSQ